jgi:hypothetical protein
MSRLAVSNFFQDRVKEQFIPGAGKFRSAAVAFQKCSSLEDVLQAYFQDTSAYDGSPIDEEDSKKAIKYVISKKFRKSVRQGIKGTFILGAAIGGAAAGATAGSIIPGAGTIAGGAGGAVGLGTLASVSAAVVDRAARGLKGVYKSCKGTRGEHREQAARALDYCARMRDFFNLPYGEAAGKALEIILGDEYEAVMATSSDESIKRIAMRIKS